MDDANGAPAKPASDSAGEMLRRARETAGLSLAEVAARTRIPLRHLEAIEASNYAGLPASTYAVGFARAHARAVGADEVGIAAEVRRELDHTPRAPEYQPYETADPSRVPPRGVTIVALGLALAVLVLVGLWYGTDLMRGGPPEQAPAPEIAAPAARPAAQPALPTAPTGGQVTLTATDEVWLRVYDAADKTLFMGTMKPGDRFDVPAAADDPRINVGRPDKLTVTLNGAAIPPLGSGARPIKDVKVGSAAVAARLAAPAPSPTAAPSPTVAAEAP